MSYKLARCAPGAVGLVAVEWRMAHPEGRSRPFGDSMILLEGPEDAPHPIFAHTFVVPLLEVGTDVPAEFLVTMAATRIGVHPETLFLHPAGGPKVMAEPGMRRLTSVTTETAQLVFDAPAPPGTPAELDAVSRSERKLRCALETFGVELPKSGLALDLGSAPGGWVRVLRSAGMRVWAVDPADLSPAVAADLGVDHKQMKVQKCVPPREPLVALTNDLRMDAESSVEQTLDYAHCLLPGAPAVMTIKLAEHGVRDSDIVKQVHKLRKRLQSEYDVVGIRQLPVNRSEVTVVLRKRPAAEPD